MDYYFSPMPNTNWAPVPQQPMPAAPGQMPNAPFAPPVMPQMPQNSPMSPGSLLTPLPDDAPETLESPIYTPGFLRTQIGKLMRVEFLVGNAINDRVGRLSMVGASYILLQSIEGTTIMCDLYSIKFVTIVNSTVAMQLYHQ